LHLSILAAFAIVLSCVVLVFYVELLDDVCPAIVIYASDT